LRTFPLINDPGFKVMHNFRSSTRWPDGQLVAILAETCNWAVNDVRGQVLCFAPCLRLALHQGANCAASGAIVVSLTRFPFDNLVVNPSQMDRLLKIITEHELMPFKEIPAWDDRLAAD
jgi:hypothetical protein